MVHMSFVDFLDAIVRLATMKGMPTDEEIKAAGCKDAGHFIHMMQATSGSAYTAFLQQHPQRWNEVPRQPIARCVEHLISLILVTVEATVGVSMDLKLTETEASQFMRGVTASSGDILKALQGGGDDPKKVPRSKQPKPTRRQPTAARGGLLAAASGGSKKKLTMAVVPGAEQA